MAITFPASPSDGDVFTNTTTGVKYIYNATDGVWKTHVWPTNTNYLQLSGGTLTGDLSLGTNDLTAQDITTTGSVTVGNGLTVSDGNVVMANGHGIDFSATSHLAGVESELLDDYEEGTWTVTLRGGAILSPTHTATPLAANAHNAKYVKIGKKVFFHFYERWDISTWTGSWSGINFELPFTPNNYAPISISYWSSFFNTGLSSAYQPAGYIDPNGLCRLTLQAITQAGESDNNNGTINFSSSAGLMISGIYTTT